MVFESNELDFLILQNGDKGEPGESKYTWIKYSKNEDGSNITDSPMDAVYIGIAYNKDSIQESDNPADYSWSKIQGDKGQDGYTVFLENENISFATDNNKTALLNQSYSSTVHVMQGTEERTDFLIGEIIADNGISVTKENKTLTIEVVEGNIFASNNGCIKVPISIDGLIFLKDITWTLALQGEDGLQGQAALNIVVGNESQNIPCNNDGVVSEQILIEIPFWGYRGFEKVPTSAIVGVLPDGITVASIENSTSEKDGLIVLSVKDGANLGNEKILRGKVILTFTIENQEIVKYFIWNKTKDGGVGIAVLYSLSSSTPVLSKQTDDSIVPNEITFSSFLKSKVESKEYAGLFIIKETTNGEVYENKYISSQNESSVQYALSSNNVVGVQCVLCEADNISNELDLITIPVLTNDSLKDKITEIENTISGVSTKVDNVDKSITDKVWKEDITTQIDSFNNTTVEEIRSQVAEQKTEIGKISSEVSDVKTTVEKKADGSIVQELEEYVTKIEQTSNEFKQTVEQNYVTNDKLGETSETLRSEFKQTAGEIQGQVSDLKGNFTAVTQDLTEIEQRVETAEGDITSLKVADGEIRAEVKSNTGEISTLKQTAGELSGRIESAEGDISSLKITSEGLATEVNSVKGEISRIDQKANEINISVGEAHDKIDNLDIVGRNLWKNSTFDYELKGYKFTDTGSYNTSKEKYENHGVLEISQSNHDSTKSLENSAKLSIKPTISKYQAEDKFVLSAFVCQLKTGNNLLAVTKKTDSTESQNILTIQIDENTPLNTWVKLESDVFIAEEDGEFFDCCILADNGGEFRISQIKFEKGDKTTEWSAAPEDTDDAIKDAQDTANKATSDSSQALDEVSKAQTSLKMLSDSLQTLVTDENGNTMMTQTSNGWTFNMGVFQSALDKNTDDISSVKGDVDEVSSLADKTNQLANDIAKKTAYINMSTDESGSPCIELGDTNSDFKLRITNTSIDFMQGSQKIAYITNQTLYIQSSVVTDEMKIGANEGFIWKKRANGNMGLRWFGGDDLGYSLWQ